MCIKKVVIAKKNCQEVDHINEINENIVYKNKKKSQVRLLEKNAQRQKSKKSKASNANKQL